MASPDVVQNLDEPQDTAIVQCNEYLVKPVVGMVFSRIEDAQLYYENYGRDNGFCVRLRSKYSTIRGLSSTVALFTCSCEGVHKKRSVVEEAKKRNTSTIQTGCKARFRVALDKNIGKWVLNEFIEDHNHFLVTPTKRGHLRINKGMHPAAKNLVEVFNRQNIEVGKVATLFGGISPNGGFGKRACWNHLKTVRQNSLGAGDAQTVLTYFQRKQEENPNFFYSVQLDAEGRATNFFWVDARSRVAYSQFGDAVAFDTTYRTNKYKMPFAPFTGINHHYSSTLFGCALLQDETEDTFVWLFDTWLQAMGNKHPVSIITDQDIAMKAAIKRIFPNTRHRLCFWHIKKKFAERLGHIYGTKTAFKAAVKRCTKETYTVEEFEVQWASMLVEFGLQDHEWLKQLYNIRQMWIPTYHRDIFFAGMNSTQRSESINSFFDSFLKSTTTLRDFVVRFEDALDKRYDLEREEDFISRYKNRVIEPAHSMDPMLRHASLVYTRTMFLKVQCEFIASKNLRADEVETFGEVKVFNIKPRTEKSSEREFLVRMNMVTKEGVCGCQLLQFLGIPCRHLHRVLDHLYVNEIPDHYIMKRWTKTANKAEVVQSEGLGTHDIGIKSEAMRISHLSRRAAQLANLGGKSEEAYKVTMEIFDQMFSKLSLLDSTSTKEDENIDKPIDNPITEVSTIDPLVILDPMYSNTKGRKSNKEKEKEISTKRLKSGLEISEAKKKPRICKTCSGHGHDSRNCSKKNNNISN